MLSAADEPSPDPARGWPAFTTGEVRAVPVPGTHYTFLNHDTLYSVLKEDEQPR